MEGNVFMEQWNEYLEALASKAPTPGGGSAAAVYGAVGTALGEMVGNLTTGKKKFAKHMLLLQLPHREEASRLYVVKMPVSNKCSSFVFRPSISHISF